MHDPRNEERAEHGSRPSEQERARFRSADDEGSLEHLVPTHSPEIAQTGCHPRFLEETWPLFRNLTKGRHAYKSYQVVRGLKGRAEPEWADERHRDYFPVAEEGR